jgi:hypothetical protein
MLVSNVGILEFRIWKSTLSSSTFWTSAKTRTAEHFDRNTILLGLLSAGRLRSGKYFQKVFSVFAQEALRNYAEKLLKQK